MRVSFFLAAVTERKWVFQTFQQGRLFGFGPTRWAVASWKPVVIGGPMREFAKSSAVAVRVTRSRSPVRRLGAVLPSVRRNCLTARTELGVQRRWALRGPQFCRAVRACDKCWPVDWQRPLTKSLRFPPPVNRLNWRYSQSAPPETCLTYARGRTRKGMIAASGQRGDALAGEMRRPRSAPLLITRVVVFDSITKISR